MTLIAWPLGDTHTRLILVLMRDATNPLDVTGINGTNITLKLRRDMARSDYIPLAGTADILLASAGKITYQFAPSDVAFPGEYRMVVTVLFPDGPWSTWEIPFHLIGQGRT